MNRSSTSATHAISGPALLIRGAIVSLFAGIVAFGCSNAANQPSPEPTATPTLVPQLAAVPVPHPITFPVDEGIHDDALEWWYYNGQLTAEDGTDYAFHFVIFQGRGEENAVAYMAHASLTDLAAGTHDQAARTLIGSQGAQPLSGVALAVDEWRLEAKPTSHALRFGAAAWTLDLTATPVKPAAFHDEDGFLVGPEGWTYYYSWPRMHVTGTLVTATSTQTITGQAWMDHQWGDFAVSGYPSGWQWFAVQFDDGTELMVTEARHKDSQTSTYGTYVREDGTTAHLTNEQISLTVEGEWTSPHTDATYPAGWHLSIPSLDLTVDLLPLVADQEVTVAFPPQTIYWEGATSVVATRDGRPVGGHAFVELVGYVRFAGLLSPRR